MQVSDIRNPNERNKLILAAGLGLVALVFLWWTFFGFGGGSEKVTPRPAAQPSPSAGNRGPGTRPPKTVEEFQEINPNELRPVPRTISLTPAPEPSRNIFVYYEPTPTPTPPPPIAPTPTPTPVPPVLLANLSPGNVFARTGDFTLEVAGDKFAPQMRIVIANSELPTRFINPQQLSARVPGAVISSPGTREVKVQSPDGRLYSNTLTMSIAAPPVPNYSYVGIIGSPRHIDTAILQDKSNKDILNVQLGDLLGGKFRVTSISERELVVIDSTLKVKHTLAMTAQGDKGNPLQRPTPRVESEDDEP